MTINAILTYAIACAVAYAFAWLLGPPVTPTDVAAFAALYAAIRNSKET